ncbi:MAG: HEAT repeat domain-containing protein [Longimicrobiales bacterium]|nr:HEAT repeat domain-containing protein [Longimicrobiales bacterium]
MSFAAREGVEICDEGIRLFGDRTRWQGRAGLEGGCVRGPVEVELRIRGGEVDDVEMLDGSARRSPAARDLGRVEARDAVAFLLDAARRGSGRGVDDAIFPVMLADVAEAWKDVLAVARDRAVAAPVRKSALFWLGQEAAAAATEGLAEVASDEDEEQEVREAAIFALSQRPSSEGVPILMELARTAREPGTRKAAFFWLAQSDDERVIAFFQEVLVGRRGG